MGYNVIGLLRINSKFMKKGFTLIELLVSLGLVAVMAAGVVTLIGRGPQQSSRDGKRRADLQRIATALELYRNDTGRYPTNACYLSNSCLVPTYIQALPTDPDPSSGNTYTYNGTACNGVGCLGFTLCTNLEKTAGTNCNEYVVTNP